MSPNSVKIVDCFDVPLFGLITEIQHGISPNTLIIDSDTNQLWIVKKRFFSVELLVDN